MPTLLIALASALLLAALVTETVSRFWPDSYLALLFIAFIALLINGLFNARLRQKPAAAAATATQGGEQPEAADTSQPQRSRAPRNSGSSRERPNRDQASSRDRGRGRKPAPREKARDKPAPAPQQDNAPRGPQESGTVKWFNRSKGYGFIIRENGEEIFVHQRSIVTQGDGNQRAVLRDGQKVSFVVAHLDKGAQAEEVAGLD